MEVKPENTMRVYISGLKGTHSLRVGIAYWYRGHYLYAVNDTRNPIEPQTFATKGKILINGSTMDTAPIYDVHNEYLIDESEIRALEKAIWTVTYYGPEWQADELDADLTKKRPSVAEVGTRLATPSFGAVQKHYVPESILSTNIRRIPSFTLNSEEFPKATGTRMAQLTKVTSASSLSNLQNVNARYDSRHSSLMSPQFHTPHDRAQYLAVSAPGSRQHSRNPSGVVSPFPTRAPSPLQLDQNDPRGMIRNRMARMAEEETFLRAVGYPGPDSFNKLERTAEWTKEQAISPQKPMAFGSSIPPPLSARREASKMAYEASKRDPFLKKAPSTPILPKVVSYDEINKSLHKAIDDGGRKALNQAFNLARPRVTKCTLHGEGCTGMGVDNEHLTARMFRTKGFVDEYPTIVREGRVIVDWQKILFEEKVAKATKAMAEKVMTKEEGMMMGGRVKRNTGTSGY